MATKLFDTPHAPVRPRYVSHRGFTPLAPENSLPGFAYAGLLGQWAIETDVHRTRDGVLVCIHNDTVDAMYDGTGTIREQVWAALSGLRLKAGNRLDCFAGDDLRMPLFDEYLAICRRYGCVPFIELKTDDAQPVIDAVRAAGFDDGTVVMSSVRLERLLEARKYAPGMFVHHIFGNERSIERLAPLGNAGMSWRVDDPLAKPVELIEKAHRAGLRVCLRAADSTEAVRVMLGLGLDYLPTNRMHAGLPGARPK